MKRSPSKTALSNALGIRLASEADSLTIARLRLASNPDDKSVIEVGDTTSALWWLAEHDGAARACLQVFERLPAPRPRFVFVWNIYYDGTSIGKRCLAELLRSFVPIEGELSLELPYAQRALVPWLTRHIELAPESVKMARCTGKGVT